MSDITNGGVSTQRKTQNPIFLDLLTVFFLQTIVISMKDLLLVKRTIKPTQKISKGLFPWRSSLNQL